MEQPWDSAFSFALAFYMALGWGGWSLTERANTLVGIGILGITITFVHTLVPNPCLFEQINAIIAAGFNLLYFVLYGMPQRKPLP